MSECLSMRLAVGGLSEHAAITTAGTHSVFTVSGAALRVLQVFTWKHT